MDNKTNLTNDPEILAIVERMPPFPASIDRILRLSNNMDTPAREIVGVIKHDPVLTMRILALVNSAYFALRKPVTSVHQAYVLLGLNTTKNLLLRIAVVATIPDIPNMGDFTLDGFLTHSLSVAVTARMIAAGLNLSDDEDYFVAGLLHDFGKLALAFHDSGRFLDTLKLTESKKLPLTDAENETYGFDHTDVGLALGNRWNLSEFLCSCMRRHHDSGLLASGLPEDPVEQGAYITAAANQIVRFLNIGFSGEYIAVILPDNLLSSIRLSHEDLPEFGKRIEEEMRQARVFLGSS